MKLFGMLRPQIVILTYWRELIVIEENAEILDVEFLELEQQNDQREAA